MDGLSRRHFLRLVALAAGASTTSTSLLASENKLNTIGIQLYTVRGLMQKDVPATLTAISKLGYKEVEFAGYFNHSPQQTKKLLAEVGLTSPSTHVGMAELRSLEQTMDMAAEIGHDYVVLAYLAPHERTSLDQYKAYVDLFSKAGEAAKSRGMQFGYHNHDFEFAKMDGVMPYDFMLNNIDSDLMKMTMDLYWITKAGQDPLTYFNKHPGRFKQCHVKDMGNNGSMVDVGSGTIDFAKIFAQSEKAGFEHYYVEHDMPKNAMQTATNSFNYLDQLVF